LLFSGTALYPRFSWVPRVERTRLVAAAVVLLLWPVASQLPAVVALLLLAIILAALNIGEPMTIKAGRALW
jgi:hypothetical protein